MYLKIFVTLSWFIGLSFLQSIHAQSIWATEVLDYTFTNSQNGFGQQPQYFPMNVLGSVANSATPTAPASAPWDVCAMGKGGHITLGFNPPIIDLPGADFTVFENAFYYGNNQIFDEWMLVSVSIDGVNWFTFPYDSLTGQGLAGRTPTAAAGANYQNPIESGGDSFDLGALGLTEIRYVRVTDATRFQTPDRLSSDLDAIVAIHQSTTVAKDYLASNFNTALVKFDINDNKIQVDSPTPISILHLYALNGESIASISPFATNQFALPAQLPACFLVLIEQKGRRYYQKVFKATI